MKEQNPARLVDIARACGVAASTVSRALKGHPGIPESTREKVREAAARLGYRPDARMDELMARVRRGRQGGGTHNLGLLHLSGTVASQRARNHIGAYARGVRARADALGYGLIETALAEHHNPARLFRDTGVAGVVVLSPSGVSLDTGVDWDRHAWAALGFIPETPALHAAVPDFAHDARRAVDWLADRGCRAPGFVHDPRVDTWLGRSWLGGFLAECLVRGLTPKVLTLPKEKFKDAPALWRRDMPDSFVLHDGQVEEIWADFADPVPVCYLNIFSSSEGRTGIIPADAESGANAVDLVAGQLRRGETGIPAFQKQITVCGRWVEASPVPLEGPPVRGGRKGSAHRSRSRAGSPEPAGQRDQGGKAQRRDSAR